MKTLKAATAGLLTLLIIAAPPYLLIRYIGNPWPPEGVSLDSALTDNAILGLLAVLVWILWAQFTVSLVVEAYAAVADKSVDVRLPVFGFQQDLARALVGAILTTVTIAPLIAGTIANPATAADSPTITPGVTTSSSTLSQSTDPVSRAPATAITNQQQHHETPKSIQIHVERGDTLWSIAEKHLGNGDRWSEIAAANQGKTMVDGRVFASADQIRPGWKLTIPGVAGSHEQDDSPQHRDYQVQAGDSLSSIAEDKLGDPNAYPTIFAASQDIIQPGGQKLTDPDHIEPAWTLSIPTDAHGSGKHRDTDEPRTDRSDKPKNKDASPKDTGSKDNPIPDTEVEDQPTDRPAAEVEPTETAEVQPSTPEAAATPQSDDEPWPIATTGGVGAVLAGALIGLIARRRSAQRRRRKPGQRIPLPDAHAERVETEVRAVADEVGVEFIDRALHSLGAYTAATQNPLPQLQAARMTPQQLDLYFSTAPDQPLPAPWQATSDPTVWILPADQQHLLSVVDPEIGALWPALVSVGHDSESGVILLNLGQLHGLAVTGDQHLTSQVMIALVVELGTAPWAIDMDLTVIGSLVELVEVLDRGRMRYVPTSHNVQFDPDRAHVVIAMSPLSSYNEQDLLDGGASVVTQTPAAEGEQHDGWRIELLDAEHATLHPIGLQINPQRVDSATYAAILNTLTSTLADPVEPVQDQVVPFEQRRTPAVAPTAHVQPVDPGPGAGALVDDAPTHTTPGGGGDRGHQLIVGDTITATRTSPEQSLILVDPVIDCDQRSSAVSGTTEPDHEFVDQEDLENLVEVGDVPAAGLDQADGPEVVDAVQHPLIRLLGPTVEIINTNTQAPTSESHLRVCTRVATYLALNPNTTRTALVEAIWSGRRISTSTVDSRISQLRNWLGENPNDGEAYLPRRSLRLSDTITTDWDQFVDLVGLDPARATTDALEAAVRLIRGRPLEGEESKHYGFAEYFAQDVIDILADATYELARRRFMAGEWNTASSAAALGIRVDPGNERLWRLRIHAAHSAGDATGTTEAIDRMHARITELGYELDDNTMELLDAITNHDAGRLERVRESL